MGRYLETDPLGQAAGINVYGYVSANPMMMTDPMGLCSVSSIIALAESKPALAVAVVVTEILGGGPENPVADAAVGAEVELSGGAAVIEAAEGTTGAATSAAAAETGSAAADYSAIGSTGQVGQDWLVENVGGQSQAYFDTSQGARFVDQFANGIANESKVGYTSLTRNVATQVSKDVELMETQQVQGVSWHFFESPVTGAGGPSQPLLNLLQQSGIDVFMH